MAVTVSRISVWGSILCQKIYVLYINYGVILMKLNSDTYPATSDAILYRQLQNKDTVGSERAPGKLIKF
jgi:hypothetical protein